MELGSALSVIRYNEGYNGILRLFSSIGVNTTGQLTTLLQKFDNTRILKYSNIILQQQKRYAKKQLRGKTVTSQLRKHGEGYSSGKYSGAQKATSSDFGDEVDARATTNPLIDSEISTPPVPQVSTRAKRIIKRSDRFIDSSEEECSDSDNPNPSVLLNFPATQKLQVTHNRKYLRVLEDLQSYQFGFKTVIILRLEYRSFDVQFVSGLRRTNLFASDSR